MNNRTNTPGPAQQAAGAERMGHTIARPAELAAAFRERATIVRDYAADEGAAAIWERAADMVEDSLRHHVMHAQRLGQPPHAPTRRAVSGGFLRLRAWRL